MNGATAVSFLQDPNDADTKKGQNTLSVSNGSYSITEPAVAGYTASYSNCTNVVIANGGTATCTITNDDNIGTPGIGSTIWWTLNDRVALSGWVSLGGASTVTFTSYRDTATLTSCEASTQIANETVAVNDAAGTATTATGYGPTETTGTYHWIASFNGNNFNAAISTACAEETTTLP